MMPDDVTNPASSPSSSEESSSGSARRWGPAGPPAARGVVFQSLSNVVLLVSGYAVHVVAARVLGSADYGRFVVVVSIVLWMKHVQDSIFVPGLFKMVSEDPARLRPALALGAKWYAPIIALLVVGFLAGAPLVARALGDRVLFVLLIVAAFELPFAAGFSLSRWSLLGLRHYGAAATASMVQSLVRMAGALTLLALGLGAVGALGGNVLGGMAGAAIAVLLVVKARKDLPVAEYPPMLGRAWAWTTRALPTMLGTATLFAVDLWLVKAFLGGATAGVYGAAYMVARLPCIVIFMSVGTSAAPRISNALARGEDRLAGAVSVEAMRVFLVLAIPCCFFVAACAGGIIDLLYGSRYADAAWPLVLLMIAHVCRAFLGLTQNLLLAADRPGVRLAIVAVLLPIGATLCWVLVLHFRMTGAAVGSLMTFALGCGVGAVLAYRYLKAVVPVKTAFRCAAVAAATYLIALLWEAQSWWVLGKLVAMGVLYLLGLVALRELTARDALALRSALGRRSGNSRSAGTPTQKGSPECQESS